MPSGAPDHDRAEPLGQSVLADRPGNNALDRGHYLADGRSAELRELGLRFYFTRPELSEALHRNVHLDPFAMRGTEPVHVPSFVGVAVAFAAAAGICYPGGTLLTRSSAGYSLTENFLSDLGMTVAYNGRPNMLGAMLFTLSLLLLVVVFGRSILGFVRHYRGVPRARAWAVAAAVLVPLACAAFAAVAVTPENRVMDLHVDVTVLAWRVSAGATCLLTVASVQADSRMRRRTVAWGTLAIALGIYVLYLAVGPALITIDGLRAQVLAQKIIAATAVSILTYLSADQYRVRPLQSGIAAT